MDTKEVWDRTGTTCAFVAYLGSHGRSKFPLCVYCSVLPYVIYMARSRVSGLIFLSGAPGRIKYSVAHVYSMAWLISIFILGVLNMVSCFGDYVISIE